jgi:nucleotide-binding universal stress UspA family protein
MDTTIVVGFVDSPTGRAAMDAAIVEAGRRGGRLSVVHSMRGGDHESPEEIAAFRDALDRLSERLGSEGVEHEVHQFVRGNSPAEDITSHAEEIGADLIVVGYRRRSPTGKLLLGSDSRDVLLSAPCPVLAVPAGDTPGD